MTRNRLAWLARLSTGAAVIGAGAAGLGAAAAVTACDHAEKAGGAPTTPASGGDAATLAPASSGGAVGAATVPTVGGTDPGGANADATSPMPIRHFPIPNAMRPIDVGAPRDAGTAPDGGGAAR